jgi:DNA-binding transcriptional LysR family regulator
VAQKKFSRFEFVWGLNSAEVVKQMTLHQINCGVVSATSIEDQGAALHSVRLFDDRVVWAVPQSIPHSAIEAVLAARTPPPPRFEALARYVEVGGGVPWHDGSENWYRAHLPFAMPYFGCLTHQGAVEFVAAGLATCHVPLSLMPSLPDTLRRELRIYNLRGFRRTAVFIMPRHLLSLRPFAEFQEQLCDFASRDYQDEMHMADVPDAPLPPDPAPAPAAAASGKAMDSIGQSDAASGSNGPQEPAVRQGGAVMILPADRGPGP